MHDGLAQALGLLHLKLQSALGRAADAPAVAEALGEMARITDHARRDRGGWPFLAPLVSSGRVMEIRPRPA